MVINPSRGVSILTGSEEPVQPSPDMKAELKPGVSILTGSEEPVQPEYATLLQCCNTVSILTGSEEPVQRPITQNRDSDLLEFQSSPAPKSRCNRFPLRRRLGGVCFNPHRLRRAGATVLLG